MDQINGLPSLLLTMVALKYLQKHIVTPITNNTEITDTVADVTITIRDVGDRVSFLGIFKTGGVVVGVVLLLVSMATCIGSKDVLVLTLP